MDMLFPQVLDEGRVLNAAHTVTDTRRTKRSQRFPYTLWTASFTCVRGPRKIVICRILVGGDMRGERKVSFITCKVQGSDTSSTKAFDQLHRLEALFSREVTEGAEDQPGFDAARRTSL